MSQGLDALSPQEFEAVKGILIALIRSLEQKKIMGSQHGLLTDEMTVLTALKHPERGDVEVIILRGHDGLEVFVSNRREPDSPFSVMNLNQAHKHVERRPLDSSQNLKDGEMGLFLVSFQDRELLREREESLIKAYSVHFGISETPLEEHNPRDDLKTKDLRKCTPEDKWEIFRRNAPGDPRVEKIKKEFFQIDVRFPKYKKGPELHHLYLMPENYRNIIGQLIRDAYPYGVRVSLRSNYPKEHKAQLDLVHQHLQDFLNQLNNRNLEQFPPTIKQFWQTVQAFVADILKNDPELSHFV